MTQDSTGRPRRLVSDHAIHLENTGRNLSPNLSPVPKNLSPVSCDELLLIVKLAKTNGDSFRRKAGDMHHGRPPQGQRDFATSFAAYTCSSCGEVAEWLKAAVC